METATTGGVASPADYADEDGVPDVEEAEDDGEVEVYSVAGVSAERAGCAHCAAPGAPRAAWPLLAVLAWLLARRRRARYSRSKIGRATMSSPNDA
jgi:MYXO-CTERM domain-containing protein